MKWGKYGITMENIKCYHIQNKVKSWCRYVTVLYNANFPVSFLEYLDRYLNNFPCLRLANKLLYEYVSVLLKEQSYLWHKRNMTRWLPVVSYKILLVPITLLNEM